MSKGFHHLAKDKKITYLIWLDRVVLELWSDYLDIWIDVNEFRVNNSKVCETVGYDWSRLWL